MFQISQEAPSRRCHSLLCPVTVKRVPDFMLNLLKLCGLGNYKIMELSGWRLSHFSCNIVTAYLFWIPNKQCWFIGLSHCVESVFWSARMCNKMFHMLLLEQEGKKENFPLCSCYKEIILLSRYFPATVWMWARNSPWVSFLLHMGWH